MDKEHKSYVRKWKFVAHMTGPWIEFIFNYSHDLSAIENIEGPVIIIPNHGCQWDPLLVGAASKNRQMYYVMTEHMVRMPFAGKFIMSVFNPILIKKGTTDLEAVKNCIRHIKCGHTICLFAEGDHSWDGVTGKIAPATGKLVKMSKATLVTYRIEGSYLSLPRWAKGIRRGKIEGHIAGIYPPEEIKKMSAEEVQHAIERDLHFDIWEWQRRMPGGPVEFKSRRKNKNYAKGLETLFFMCPGCANIGTLKTHNNEIFCECGFKARLLNTGFIELLSPAMDHPPYDLTTLPGWDMWQKRELKKLVEQIHAGRLETELFRDRPAILSLVKKDHKDTILSKGDISLSFCREGGVLSVGDHSFILDKITDMALALNSRILFSYGKDYYQIRTKDINIRKYMLAWNT